MKMLIAIIDEKYLADLMEELLKRNVRVTKLSSSGGFLGRKSSTLMLGVEEEQLSDIKNVFKELTNSEEVSSTKDKVTFHGSTIFVIDVRKGYKI